MATTPPPRRPGLEKPDVTILMSYMLDRLAEFPWLRATFCAAMKVRDENGGHVVGFAGKKRHRRAKGWQTWSIWVGSDTQAGADLLTQMLTNITIAILQGAGSVDVDTAIENEVTKLELLRRDGQLPAGARVEGIAP